MRKTTDEKVEALARAMHEGVELAYITSTRNADWPPDPKMWKALSDPERRMVRAGAVAALRHLNCVNSKGEVFVPDVRAAVELIETVQVNTQEPATESICGKALRALTGGTDEG